MTRNPDNVTRTCILKIFAEYGWLLYSFFLLLLCLEVRIGVFPWTCSTSAFNIPASKLQFGVLQAGGNISGCTSSQEVLYVVSFPFFPDCVPMYLHLHGIVLITCSYYVQNFFYFREW